MKVLTNFSFLGDEAFDIRCFSGAKQDFSYYDNQRPSYFPQIMEKIPLDWEPDIVLFKSPMYFAVPFGIENSPFPTVLLLDDWFGGVDYLPDVFAKFDYIFTDKTSCELLKKLGFTNVDYWPLFPFAPEQFHLMPGIKRDLDISFTGNFNVNVQGRRLSWLRRVASIDKKYSVGFFHKAWNEEYTEILNRSRIVFNHSIKGEMNQRAFEVPACGALLMMEHDNLEVRDFFTPGSECVLYTDDNFEELLAYYLDHEEDRSRIARKGYERVQNFTQQKLFAGLLNKIEDLHLMPGKARKGETVFFAAGAHRDFVQSSLAKFGRGESTLKNIPALLADPQSSGHILNDCAVVLLAYADDCVELGVSIDMGKIVSATFSMIDNAVRIIPGYPVAVFNKAQMLFFGNKKEEAKQIYLRLFNLTTTLEYDNGFKGLVYPLTYGYPLRNDWSHAISQSLPDSTAMAENRLRVLRFYSAVNLAAVAAIKGEAGEAEAIDWYEKAYDLVPDHALVSLPLARLLAKRNHARARELAAVVLSVNPFDFDFWTDWAAFLGTYGTREESRSFIESCLLCLSRLQMATPQLVRKFEVLLSQA